METLSRHAKIQTSETFLLSAILALSGGFQDAYTYNVRNGVFSNAQTGNVVLMSQHLMEGNWMRALHYLFPVLAFAFGVLVAERIGHTYKNARKIHWRQIVVLIEILILLAVGFMPQKFNMAATMLVSFACAMQVQTFRKVNGYAFASTMCIGNMRSGMDSLCSWVLNRNPAALKKSLYYWGIILLFALGAGLGSLTLDLCGAKAIWLSCLLLAVSFCLMFLKEDVEEIKEDLEALEAKH